MAMRRTLTEENTSQLFRLEDKCKRTNSSTVDLCFPVWWLSAIGGDCALEMCWKYQIYTGFKDLERERKLKTYQFFCVYYIVEITLWIYIKIYIFFYFFNVASGKCKIPYVAQIIFLLGNTGVYSNSIKATFQTESSDDSILGKFSEIQNSLGEQIISKNKNEMYYSHLISHSARRLSSCSIL